jgi:VWFA-related protein
MTLMKFARRILGTLLCASLALFVRGQAAPPAQTPASPTLKTRPPAPPRSPVFPKGRMLLNLSVTDAAGNPVTDLEPWDLKLTDNGKPAKILSFRGYDGKTVLPNPPVEVILVIDELDLSPQLVAFMRDQAMSFLRQNGGRPELPISIMLLTDRGLRVQPQPSLDGNGMAALVRSIQPSISSINPAMGAEGLLERVQRSIREMQRIADNEAQRPARKILIWMGPGWPMLDSTRYQFTDQQRQAFFSSIVFLLNGLRRAQITVYGMLPEFSSMGIDESRAFRYKAYFKPVLSPRHAMPEDLALGVLAEETGGGIRGPSNNLVAEMNACLTHANAYYRISFDPQAAVREDEYHALHVDVERPGLTVRSNTGYYDEPGQSSLQGELNDVQ